MHWIAFDRGASQSINQQEAIVKVVICTHTAPFSNKTIQDDGEKWQVKVKEKNEDLIGFLMVV